MPRFNKNKNGEAFTLSVSNQSALIGIGIVGVAIILGTILFHWIEGWDWFHSLYYVAITISTVGYGDITAITHSGKILTMLYALIGVPLFIFAAGLIIEARIRGFVVEHLHHHQQQINKLKAENKKEDKAIAEISEDIEEFSDTVGDATQEMQDVIQALSKAQNVLKKRQAKG